MAPARVALISILCLAMLTLSVGRAAAEPPAATSSGASSPALIGLSPGATTSPAPAPAHRKLWIALGVVSGVAVVGALVAVGVSLGTSTNNHSVYNDWGTLTVMRR